MRGYSGAAVFGGDRESKSSDVWIDLRWKTTSQASWPKRLFGPGTVVKIK
jgi:hypothetical protein